MNTPPGTTRNTVEGQRCPQCGQRGCGCEPEPHYDPRTFQERVEDERSEERFEKERGE